MTDAHSLTVTHFCKQPGCGNEARSPVGRYSYCEEHQGRAAKAKPKGAVNGTVYAKLASLQAGARRVDKLRAKAESLTRQALAAKAEADEAHKEFQRSFAEMAGGVE